METAFCAMMILIYSDFTTQEGLFIRLNYKLICFELFTYTSSDGEANTYFELNGVSNYLTKLMQ
jgi:hypothetical protein